MTQLFIYLFVCIFYCFFRSIEGLQLSFQYKVLCHVVINKLSLESATLCNYDRPN